jgi:hypothetical protein
MRQECIPASSPVDILDHLEVAGTVVDLADGSWSQFAHQLAQQDAILERFFVTGTCTRSNTSSIMFSFVLVVPM